MSERIFKKNTIYRFSAYLLLLPFIPALRPILNHHEMKDLIVFAGGFILTALLVVFSNNQPYIKTTDKNLFIYLMHRHKPEIHYFSSIEKVIVSTKRKLMLHTSGFDPLEIRLSRKQLTELVILFEEKDIPVSKVYRS